MDSLNKSRKDHLRVEFIKSAAILLLAFILLVAAVFAWFKNQKTYEVVSFEISIETPEAGDVEIGDDVTIDREVILPAATKIEDNSISAKDLSKVIAVEVYNVRSISDVDIEVIITPKEGTEGLYYYIDTDYTEDVTYMDLAETIKDNLALGENNPNNKTAEFTIKANNYQKVAIVYWADYDIHNQTIVTDKIVKMPVEVHFKNSNEETNGQETTA